ncbi:hypothetical protein AYO20_00724 [Fonsecaea nubica]|uniref:NADH dehydrogenase [ubiquinone] 1 alpha subcomplex assembly factor 3 n=1 Tax=Fonsecaea nubica TaxID=856822 RepID=A0A178DDS4_9EURO|nr:hypothetical protein AYO20_00724 [Fonsecaea nubica]OAL39812.1 hypothetical protein AYO20_00724 [Fonsecaea nubica]
MRAPSTDLLRALRHATATAAPRQSLLSVHSTPSQISRCVAIASTRRQICHTPSSPTRHVRRALSTTASPSRQQTPSGPSSSDAVSRARQINPRAPKTHDRGPPSKEDTQTDFSKMDILASAGVEEPATSIDACTADGFYLNNGVHTSGGKGVMLFGGEAFLWQPWMMPATHTTASASDSEGGKPPPPQPPPKDSRFTAFLNPRGLLTFPPSTLGLLSLLYPKPDLLILGTGRRLWMLSRETRKFLSEDLGIKVDVMDTANAAAAYNLLVMERGVEEVGSILIPEGWAGR